MKVDARIRQLTSTPETENIRVQPDVRRFVSSGLRERGRDLDMDCDVRTRAG